MTTLSELGDAVDAVSTGAEQLSTAPHGGLLTGRATGQFADAAAWLSSVLPDGARAPARVRVVRFGFPADAPPPAAGDSDVRDVRATGDDMGAAIALGRDVADDEIERGADLLVVVVGRIGVAAEVVTAVLADAEPVKVLPRGAGLEPSEWMSRAERVRDGRRSAMAARNSADELLGAVGDSDLAAATAFLLRSAGRRTPAVLDGFGALAAALLAYDVQTRTGRWYLVADSTGSPGEELALSRLGQRALLDLGVGLEDGTAGLLAATVLRCAAEVANPGAA
jgi:nicotinate-nucleotide--dimethylbenzimidazole phosphoribosyltransferase